MLIFDNGNFYNAPEPENPVLADLVADRKAHVDYVASFLRSKAVARAHPGEMALWPTKLAEALQPDKTGTLIETEAATRGVPVDALAARIIAASKALKAREAEISGTRGKHNDALDALTTVEQVLTYDISAGWTGL